MDYEEIFTPSITAIDDLSDFLGYEKEQFVKAIAKKAIYDDKEEIIIFFIRGDDELEETKALNAVNANELIDASEEELEKAGVVPGFIGPKNLEARYVVDNELKDAENLIIGANKKDYHIQGYCIDLEDEFFADLIRVQEGDICPKCGGRLRYSKGIEVGHIFQLGTKYSKALDANFLDKNCKTTPFVMGTYGIGVSRLIAAIIEQNHDDKGMIWTKESSPYMVDIVTANIKDEEQKELSLEIYNRLKEKNIDVIWDDRNERLGFKMKDFELIGFPYALIVGKSLKDGMVELVERKTLKKSVIKKEKYCKN